MVDNILLGLQTALSPENVLWCFVGVLAGTVIGLLPGLGSSTGVAVLIQRLRTDRDRAYASFQPALARLDAIGFAGLVQELAES